LISRLPIIADCIATEFAYFLDPQYYTRHETNTWHYYPGTHPAPMHICKETIYRNEYYETHPVIREQIAPQIPRPLSTQKGDTYASLLAMNHRNIHDPETQEYYQRCIDRFQRLWNPPLKEGEQQEPVWGIYIHPTINQDEYEAQRETLLQDIGLFHTRTLPEHWSSVYFIMVRTEHPYPITKYVERVIEPIFLSETKSETKHLRIYKVYTTRDFIDAGEIFMQNAYIETDKMCEIIQAIAQ
jgi:hypothetical protein